MNQTTAPTIDNGRSFHLPMHQQDHSGVGVPMIETGKARFHANMTRHPDYPVRWRQGWFFL